MSLASSIGIGLFCGATLFGWTAMAEPLDRESCANLQNDRKQLLNKEMQTALDHGADWVKSHLSETEIDRVRKFLAIEEQIEFRCRGGGITKTQAQTTPPGVVPLPDRKPTAPPTDAQTNASQALADSDKTAPSKPKATR
jgi:hypothetical protein